MRKQRRKKVMNKRVYGVLGIVSIMANWNADFSGSPKTTTTGNIFGSDKALKYPMKRMWESQGEKVLYVKSLRFDEGKDGELSLIPKSLLERYKQLFGDTDSKNNKEILTNLFKAIDVKNFGATFAEVGANISITGAVQIGQGFNKYQDSAVEEQQILSPFRDSKKDGKNSTLGTKIVSDEAHYFYPFSINPMAYDGFKDLEVTQGYTEEDYQKFKQAALSSATSFATNAKMGCDNEFGLFIEADADLYLPNLAEMIKFEKGDKNLITFEGDELLNKLSKKIQKIEIYYNPLTTQLNMNIEGAKIYNIFTQEEV